SSSLCSSLPPSTTSLFHTLSLHDALPISLSFLVQLILHREIYQYPSCQIRKMFHVFYNQQHQRYLRHLPQYFLSFYDLLIYAIQDRKSTRLNSSHVSISYAVFCLKRKNQS